MNIKLILRAILIMIITTICCSYFGQILLEIIERTKDYYKYLIFLVPFALLITKQSYKVTKTNTVNMKYIIQNSKEQTEKISWYFPMLLTINTLLAHALGVSVGREGVAVQLGGAIGSNLSDKKFTKEQKNFLVRLGMICGFAALFQTWLAAFFFILEITKRKVKLTAKTIVEFLVYLLLAYFSTKLSHKLGLEKFFVEVDFNFSSLSPYIILKILLGTILAVLVGIIFVIVQKYFKKIVLKNTKVPWLLTFIFMLIAILVAYRYNSLGTNLIGMVFSNEKIESYDFILKLLLTALCTAVGFSGGEVTPLFAIGATFGVFFATTLGVPVLIMAGLCYALVFSAATKTFLTPIFLILEVFGFKLMLLAIVPSLLIYFINKKWSIYG